MPSSTPNSSSFEAMSAVLPPIFLFVAAFLVNMTLTRLVALEREQIGLMKALGYGSGGVAWHYLKFVMAIGAIGVVIGLAAGTWLGQGSPASTATSSTSRS
jgi:putative ABC transport system permease protein